VGVGPLVVLAPVLWEGEARGPRAGGRGLFRGGSQGEGWAASAARSRVARLGVKGREGRHGMPRGRPQQEGAVRAGGRDPPQVAHRTALVPAGRARGAGRTARSANKRFSSGGGGGSKVWQLQNSEERLQASIE
jgi:hypothetical protein